MDMVSHPPHYEGKKFEVIEVIEEYGLNHHKACAIKYILRAGVKDPEKYIEDLEKAVWYLKRQIELRKAHKNGVSPKKPKDM